jgi:hypothetical protein
MDPQPVDCSQLMETDIPLTQGATPIITPVPADEQYPQLSLSRRTDPEQQDDAAGMPAVAVCSAMELLQSKIIMSGSEQCHF